MKRLLVMTAACLCLAVQSCTCQDIYQGVYEQQRRECYEYKSQKEIQECLDRNSMTYDQYEKARENPKKY